MIERQAVRALLINPQNELLLMKVIDPTSKRFFWLTPGGGLDPGETPLAGLRREIFEETGLLEVEIGPQVWHREKQFSWNGETIRQKEQYYLVRVAHFEATPQHMPDAGERDTFGEFRWWPLAEMEQSPDDFAPNGLSRLLRGLLQAGPPSPPLVLTE